MKSKNEGPVFILFLFLVLILFVVCYNLNNEVSDLRRQTLDNSFDIMDLEDDLFELGFPFEENIVPVYICGEQFNFTLRSKI
jgi:hypothetical protein